MKLAVIGAGDVAVRDYLPEIHRLPSDVEVVAICSRTSERAKTVAARFGIKDWYTDYGQMLEVTDSEAVINLTPMQLHSEINRAILEAGRHLYSEKPLASYSADADDLHTLASGLRPRDRRSAVCNALSSGSNDCEPSRRRATWLSSFGCGDRRRRRTAVAWGVLRPGPVLSGRRRARSRPGRVSTARPYRPAGPSAAGLQQ